MDRPEILQVLRRHFESQFPRDCNKCGRHFTTLSDYIRNTSPLGSVQSIDIELGHWQPPRPVGSLVFANCACGTTIALSSDGMPLETRHAILAWVKAESKRRQVEPPVVLDELREEIRRLVTSSS